MLWNQIPFPIHTDMPTYGNGSESSLSQETVKVTLTWCTVVVTTTEDFRTDAVKETFSQSRNSCAMSQCLIPSTPEGLWVRWGMKTPACCKTQVVCEMWPQFKLGTGYPLGKLLVSAHWHAASGWDSIPESPACCQDWSTVGRKQSTGVSPGYCPSTESV